MEDIGTHFVLSDRILNITGEWSLKELYQKLCGISALVCFHPANDTEDDHIHILNMIKKSSEKMRYQALKKKINSKLHLSKDNLEKLSTFLKITGVIVHQKDLPHVTTVVTSTGENNNSTLFSIQKLSTQPLVHCLHLLVKGYCY